MKIKKSVLEGIIREYVSEALKYDKSTKRYFPDYTGNKHSDAGKYQSNNGDDYNYSRNDYRWHNKANQDKFETHQIRHDIDPWPTDPNTYDEDGAQDYLNAHKDYYIVDKAIADLTPKFESLVQDFVSKAAEQYPILKQRYYQTDLLWKLRDVLEDF